MTTITRVISTAKQFEKEKLKAVAKKTEDDSLFKLIITKSGKDFRLKFVYERHGPRPAREISSFLLKRDAFIDALKIDPRTGITDASLFEDSVRALAENRLKQAKKEGIAMDPLDWFFDEGYLFEVTYRYEDHELRFSGAQFRKDEKAYELTRASDLYVKKDEKPKDKMVV